MLLTGLLRPAVLALLLATSLVMAADAPSAGAGKAARVPQPVIEAARGGQCVEDPAYMRRNHMELLKHQRDDTMHGGIRGAKYSLKTCIECHASQASNSVTATSTNFCVSCHSYAAVKIDCFECHATQPSKTASVRQVKP
jgi:predicted CXXCH cytochrome family protein